MYRVGLLEAFNEWDEAEYEAAVTNVWLLADLEQPHSGPNVDVSQIRSP